MPEKDTISLREAWRQARQAGGERPEQQPNKGGGMGILDKLGDNAGLAPPNVSDISEDRVLAAMKRADTLAQGGDKNQGRAIIAALHANAMSNLLVLRELKKR
jgi:hypothetical protein